MEKLLPQNIEAELGVLGSIILDPEAIIRVSDFLYAEDFYRDAHRAIYEAITSLYEHREPADFITLCDELERRGKLEEIGGAGYITSLVNQVPTSGNVEFYGRIVERTAILRRLIFAAGQIVATAYEESDAKVALERSEQLLFQVGKRYTTTDFASGTAIMAAYMEKLDQLHMHPGSLLGVPTGFRFLDKRLGGLQKSDLIIVAGRPGMGKSSLSCSIAYNAILHHKKRVAIFTLEMDGEQLMQKFISYYTGIDSQYLRNGHLNEDDWDKIVEAQNALSTDLLQIDDTPALSLMAMRSKARRLMADAPIDLIIVDYLQLMEAYTASGKRYDTRLQEVSEISKGLKALAKELKVPILALAQLSRAVEARADKLPQLSDLRESGTIEQDSDVVLLLYRDDYYAGIDPETGKSLSKRPGTADIIIAKNRTGPVGELTVRFLESQTRFLDRDEGMTSY